MGRFPFTVFDPDTGAVVRSGDSTNKRAAELQLRAPGLKLSRQSLDPATQYMPGGKVRKRQRSEGAITPKMVKAHAARLLGYSDWYVLREIETGTPMPDDVKAYRIAVRQRCGVVEAMTPIPADFWAPKYWPKA